MRQLRLLKNTFGLERKRVLSFRELSKAVWEASNSITFSYNENTFQELDLMKMPFIS